MNLYADWNRDCSHFLNIFSLQLFTRPIVLSFFHRLELQTGLEFRRRPAWVFKLIGLMLFCLFFQRTRTTLETAKYGKNGQRNWMVGRAGFEPATHRFLRFRCLFCTLDRLGDLTAKVAEVYSIFVTMKMVARKLYQAELPPAHLIES
jgi:hypothetical protein